MENWWMLVVAGLGLGLALLMLSNSWGRSWGRPAPPLAPPPAILVSDPEIQALLASGQTIAAIKRARELTGMGLKQAKEAIEAMQAGVGAAFPGRSAPAPPAQPAVLEAEVRALLAQGAKIEAIKRVRAATGWGLKEAKDKVEAIARQQRG